MRFIEAFWLSSRFLQWQQPRREIVEFSLRYELLVDLLSLNLYWLCLRPCNSVHPEKSAELLGWLPATIAYSRRACVEQ
jgi:hypothetical protein